MLTLYMRYIKNNTYLFLYIIFFKLWVCLLEKVEKFFSYCLCLCCKIGNLIFVLFLRVLCFVQMTNPGNEDKNKIFYHCYREECCYSSASSSLYSFELVVTKNFLWLGIEFWHFTSILISFKRKCLIQIFMSIVLRGCVTWIKWNESINSRWTWCKRIWS